MHSLMPSVRRARNPDYTSQRIQVVDVVGQELVQANRPSCRNSGDQEHAMFKPCPTSCFMVAYGIGR